MELIGTASKEHYSSVSFIHLYSYPLCCLQSCNYHSHPESPSLLGLQNAKLPWKLECSPRVTSGILLITRSGCLAEISVPITGLDESPPVLMLF
jgi:hypothetical protein